MGQIAFPSHRECVDLVIRPRCCSEGVERIASPVRVSAPDWSTVRRQGSPEGMKARRGAPDRSPATGAARANFPGMHQIPELNRIDAGE
jgi:hypothetical protein